MKDIHPNDIGLATFADVGDVAKLRTVAKTVVSAINELYQSGGTSSGIVGNQVYVDGNNNIVVGENNVVVGNNNLVLGSNNVVIGDNVTLMFDESLKYTSSVESFGADAYEPELKRVYYVIDDGETLPFKIGDKVVIRVHVEWFNEETGEYMGDTSNLMVTDITGINEEASYITVDNLNYQTNAPADGYTSIDSVYADVFIPINDLHAFDGKNEGLSFGTSAIGIGSASFNAAQANGLYTFAANNGSAEGESSTALGNGMTSAKYAFAANAGKSQAIGGTALNYGMNCALYSIAGGYGTRTYGRTFKVSSIDVSKNTITLESGQKPYGLVGLKFCIRTYTNNDPVLFRGGTISEVSGNTITYKFGTFSKSTSESTKERLPAEALLCVFDTAANYSNGNFALGYHSVAASRFAFADGNYVLAGAEGAAIFGKFGNITEPYAFGIGNGTSLSAPGLAFKVLNDGSVHADSAYTTPCADYAEFFEWADGNITGEDRAGYFVKLDGEKIVKCGEFDKPLGIVSATPAIVGDSGELHWKHKFITDDFGRIQYHDVVVPAEYDEEGNLISEEHMEKQPVINPEWDSSEEYIPRKDRVEWSPVGVLGKLIVYDDGTLKSGDICRTGPDGIAVKSIENGYPVLKRVADDKVLVWFKG